MIWLVMYIIGATLMATANVVYRSYVGDGIDGDILLSVFWPITLLPLGTLWVLKCVAHRRETRDAELREAERYAERLR